MFKPNLTERFWHSVNKHLSGCWEWIGHVRRGNRDKATKGRSTNQNLVKRFCCHGHEFTPENTRLSKRSGLRYSEYERVCITCVRERGRKRRDKLSPSGLPQVHTTTPRGPAGGSFKLVPFTPKGAAQLPEIERLLARLPHTGDL